MCTAGLKYSGLSVSSGYSGGQQGVTLGWYSDYVYESKIKREEKKDGGLTCKKGKFLT